MTEELSILIERLNSCAARESNIIPWGSPILSFGSLANARIATLGLNPSNLEFLDNKGKELDGPQRRFHTLNSLGITDWTEATTLHFAAILQFCEDYFIRNPYDQWFKRLDYIISGSGISYYFPSFQACHLDLIPYATASKWMHLSGNQRLKLFELADDTLGLLLKKSPVEMLVLNGMTVVSNLERISGVSLQKSLMTAWTLPRKTNGGVKGYAFRGKISNLGGIELDREIDVIGYNHNIQSSFGVTKQVQNAIRQWVSEIAKEVMV